MISVKELQKCIDSRAKWIARNKDGTVKWFAFKPYSEGYTWECNMGLIGTLGVIDVEEFKDISWDKCYIELEPELDYGKWIGCLCWFWNDEVEKEDNKEMGTLLYIKNEDEIDADYMFVYDNGDARHCRPVRRDEVTFAEEGE